MALVFLWVCSVFIFQLSFF